MLQASIRKIKGSFNHVLENNRNNSLLFFCMDSLISCYCCFVEMATIFDECKCSFAVFNKYLATSSR